jgi:Surface antigen variable number repeat
MTCYGSQAGFVLVCALICQPPISAQARAPGSPADQHTIGSSPSSRHEQQPGPEVTVAELTFQGDLRMPLEDQDGIASSIKQRTYRGEPDAVESDVAELVTEAWQDHGYFKAQAHGNARLLTSSPMSDEIAVTVHVLEGQQYRLEEITFKGNTVITSGILRSLFPINDGDVFNREAVVTGLENLRMAYSEIGYVNFTSVPTPSVNEERQTVSFDIDMDEGKQFYVSTLHIIGLDENLLKDSPLQPGDIYNPSLAYRFIQEHAPSSLTDEPPQAHIQLYLNERAAAVEITYDFRDCLSQGNDANIFCRTSH